MTAGLNRLFRVRKAHLKAAASTLTQAFQDEPLWIHFIPDASKRKEKVHYMFEFVVRYGITYGEVYATSPAMEGVLAWVPSARAEMTLGRQMRCGVIPLALRMGIKLALRQIPSSNYMRAAHERLAPFQHAYLLIIGIAPQLQGQGYASGLLRPLFKKLDRENLPCFLETHRDENIPIYQHYGFQILEETIFPGSKVKNVAMLRPPCDEEEE
ncbi:MAG TPA: GNAT family N-acetyltransferase [Thermoflexia bacterium]|nr:GNAT family N-acetyltransferase [Thermoflexia bacterium]